ncbi:hypothetical protein, partial [Romboutsia sp.]|uniref:hypothetical protein n=1 Tax=Romboutsia sp. TaxID=1965302 RepID=UPI003F32298E
SCKEPEKIITYSDLNPIDLIEYLEDKNYILLSDEEEKKHRIIPAKEIVDIREIKSKLKGERKYRYDGVKKYKPEIDDYIFSYRLIIK